jgi:hypothetical protein
MYDKIEVARQSGQLVGKVRDRGEILGTLDSLDDQLGEMEKNIEELTKRIEAVLAPQQACKGAENPATPHSSPLAQTLYARTERLMYFNSLLQELSERVQL